MREGLPDDGHTVGIPDILPEEAQAREGDASVRLFKGASLPAGRDAAARGQGFGFEEGRPHCGHAV